MKDSDLLKNSEDKYRSIFDHMFNGAALHKVVTDKNGKPVDYVFLEINSAFERMTGLRGKEIIGKKVTDILPGIENDPANWITKHGNVGIGGKAVSFEDYSEPLKKWFSIHSYSPMEGYFVSIFEDITKQKEAELSIDESEAFNKSLLNSSPDVIYIYSLIETKNIYTHNGISDILGYTAEDILEMGSSVVASLMHPDDFENYKKDILPRYASLIDKEHLEHEYRMKHRNGKWFWIQSKESIYQRDKDGNPTQVFGLMTDITEKILNEEKLILSENKFRDLYNNSPDMYVSVSSEDATIIQCNNTLLEKTGYSKEEIIGSKVFRMYHEDSMPAAEEAFTQFIEKGKINNKELILKRKNGSKIHVSLNVSSVRDLDGKILYSISSWRDIGDRILSREKVLQEKNKAQQYLDVAGVMLLSLDKDGLVQLINRKGCEVLAYSEEEIIGKDWIENFLPKRVRKAVRKVHKKVFTGEIEPQNYYENEILTKTKEEKTIAWNNATLRDEKGNITGTLSSGEDITSRKQMEQELKNSELRYKTLYKNAPLPYHSLDEEGCFIEINPAWLATLGYERKEIIGKYYGDFLHPDWKDIFRKKFPKFKKSGHVHTSFKIRHRNGNYLDIDLNGNIGQNLDGSFKQTNCVFQDITSSKKAQEDLIKNQFYLSKAQEIGTIGTWEIDLHKNTISWTEESYKIFDVPLGTEVNYDLFLKCIHPDDRDYVNTEWAASIKGKPYDIEHRLLLGKQVKWVREKADFQFDEKGNRIFAIGVTQDITTQKKAEEQIRESEEKYRALYENAPLPYQSLNKDGTFRDVNPAWLSTLGYTRDEVIGKKYADFLHPEWQAHFEKSFPAFKKRGYVTDVQFKIRHKKGHYVDISFEGCIGYHPDGSFKQTYCVFQDITERKKSERLLVENEHKFRLLVDNTQDWEYWMNEKNEYVFSSPSCEQITGYRTEDFYANSNLLFELVHPEHRENVVTHYLDEEQHDLTSTFNTEFKIVSKDGAEKWIEHICKPVYNDKKEFIGRRGKNRDITIRKNAGEALKINEEKHRTILETALDGYWIVDMKGKLLEVNNAYSEMSGYSKEELLDLNVEDVDAEDNSEDIAKRIQTIKEKGGFQFEARHRKKDGSIFNVEISVKYLPFDGGRIVCFIHDITKRKRDEIELRLNEQRLDTLVQLNQMTDEELNAVYDLTLSKAIELTKSEIGFLGFVNEAETVVSIYSWSDSAMKEYSVQDHSIEFNIEDAGIWGEVVRTRDTLLINNYKAPNPLKKGLPLGHIAIKNYLSIPVISNGKAVAMVSVSNKDSDYTDSDAKQLSLLLYGMWNIVEQRKEKEELKIAKNRAEEADRLKSAFLANMSHEIRTPMNGILGFTNLLKKPNLSGEKKQDYIEIIRKSGDRMLRTVNDIIEISRIETEQIGLSISEVDLNELCDYLYLFFKPEAENKQIQFNFSSTLDDHQKLIRTDEVKLNSILTNLIKNSLKYSNEGSIAVACKVKDKFLEFSIKDTGIGIPEERVEAVFDRFVQADIEDRGAYEGSGLGLAITKSYVEMLGGSIWLESKVGSGTTVSFTIDFVPVKVKEVGVESDPITKKEKAISKKLILVAEDDEVSYLLLENILPSENYTLLWAKNGKEAIDLFKKTKGIDFILMDLKMPVIDGLEATRQIRKLDPKIPIIAQTAYAMDGDREQAIEAGCIDYISKPIDFDYFEKIINDHD